MKRQYILGLAGIIAAASLVGCGAENTDQGPQTEVTSEASGSTETASEAGSEPSSKTEDGTEAVDEGTEKNEEGATEASTEAVTEAVTEAAKPETDENGVHLGDYTGFTYYRNYVAPTEKDVEETIQEILDSNTTREYLKEGTVKEGDTIVVTFSGSVDGAEDDNLSGEEEEFTVGNGTFLDEFESNMVGQEVGKGFKFSIDFPEDYEEKAVAGKTADFEAVVESIAGEEKTAELTDEWVKENSDFATVDEYKENIMSMLEQQQEEYADSSVIYSLLSDLYNVCYVEVTDEELEAAIEAEKTKYEAAAEDMEMDFDEYVKEYMSTGTAEEEETEGDYMAKFNEYLKNQVEADLEHEKILASFCEKENVDISEEAYQKYLEDEASMYGYDSADEFLEELEAVGYTDEIHDIFVEVQAGRKLMELSEEIVAEEAETEIIETEAAEPGTEASESTEETVTEDASADEAEEASEDVTKTAAEEDVSETEAVSEAE